MISRTWHGLVPEKHENGFEKYLNAAGVKEALETRGNLGAYVKKILQDGYCHFFLCTIQDSREAIIQYAGKTPHIAITFSEDEKYGLISDPIVIHQEVKTSGNPFTDRI